MQVWEKEAQKKLARDLAVVDIELISEVEDAAKNVDLPNFTMAKPFILETNV